MTPIAMIFDFDAVCSVSDETEKKNRCGINLRHNSRPKWDDTLHIQNETSREITSIAPKHIYLFHCQTRRF